MIPDFSSLDQMTVGPEALEWLQGNNHSSALASNRFGPTENAIKFVKRLYAAGSSKVLIPQDSIRDDEMERALGGPYADSLVVFMPADKQARHVLFAICAREADEEGFNPGEDTGEPFVFLWWD